MTLAMSWTHEDVFCYDDFRPTAQGIRRYGDEPVALSWAVFPPADDLSDEEIADRCGAFARGCQPGGTFADRPYVHRTATRILLIQRSGIDC